VLNVNAMTTTCITAYSESISLDVIYFRYNTV
jgi:hypothetical protein